MDSSVVEANVRVCATCKKPVRALDRAEYTTQRAVLIVERGLCMCATAPEEKKPPAAETKKPARATRSRTSTTRRRRTADTAST